MISGKRIVYDLQGWLSPPDPSTNHNTACGAQQEKTAMWIFSENIYKEWESSGSLLWIHGQGWSPYRRVFVSSDGTFCSWLGKNYSLVRLVDVSLYAEAYFLE